MSVSVHQRASHVRAILTLAIILGVMVFLMFLAVGASQSGRVSETQEEMFHLPATQPLEGGGSIVYGEATAMP